MSLSLQLLFKPKRRSARSTGEKVHNGSELIIFFFFQLSMYNDFQQKDEEAVIYFDIWFSGHENDTLYTWIQD